MEVPGEMRVRPEFNEEAGCNARWQETIAAIFRAGRKLLVDKTHESVGVQH